MLPKTVKVFAALCAFVLMLTGASTAWSIGSGGGVVPNATCNPETNPDCADGGNDGQGPCPIDCTTHGTTISTSMVCDPESCGFDPFLLRYRYSGTAINHRESTGPLCETSHLDCWDGLSCGGCTPP